MQSASSRIWTRVAVSISYDDNHYTTTTFLFVSHKIFWCQESKHKETFFEDKEDNLPLFLIW